MGPLISIKNNAEDLLLPKVFDASLNSFPGRFLRHDHKDNPIHMIGQDIGLGGDLTRWYINDNKTILVAALDLL